MEGVAPQFVRKLLLKCCAQAFRRGRRLNVITGLEGYSIQMTYGKGGTLKLFPIHPKSNVTGQSASTVRQVAERAPRVRALSYGPPARWKRAPQRGALNTTNSWVPNGTRCCAGRAPTAQCGKLTQSRGLPPCSTAPPPARDFSGSTGGTSDGRG